MSLKKVGVEVSGGKSGQYLKNRWVQLKSTQKNEVFAVLRILQAKMQKPSNLFIFWSEFDNLNLTFLLFHSFKLGLHLIGEYNKWGNKLEFKCLVSC